MVSARVSSLLLDEARQERARARAEAQRLRRGLSHRVEFFYQVDDPYSHLLAQALVRLVERYDIEVVTWLVPAPEDWAAPERARLESYGLADARRLALKSGFSFRARALPEPMRTRGVQHELLTAGLVGKAEASPTHLQKIVEVGEQLWHSGPEGRPGPAADEGLTDQALESGRARRDELGHYLGATCFYAGEWTWGIDRLVYLEERLAALGALRPDKAAGGTTEEIFAPPPLLVEPAVASANTELPKPAPPDLHFFLSFRSPYTYVVTERVRRLAEAYGVSLRLRFVLPMVMRGLPVARAKRFYILRDAAREAERHGVPFGRIADPVGRPVERGYSLLPWAISSGRGADYCQAFMTAVWSQAIDAGSTRGLRLIVEAAGLSWHEAEEHLDGDGWQEKAEENRQELLNLGLWGVPSFRIGELAVWGQDRLWVLEDELKRLLQAGQGAQRPTHRTAHKTTEEP